MKICDQYILVASINIKSLLFYRKLFGWSLLFTKEKDVIILNIIFLTWSMLIKTFKVYALDSLETVIIIKYL